MLPIPRLRHWRQRRALSQEDLAKLADMQQASIARIEKRKTARPSTIRRLAEVLNVSVDDLMRDPEQGQLEAAA